MRRHLQRAGIALRPLVRHVLEPDPGWWRRQFEAGRTITELALSLEVPQTSIRAHLRKLDVQRPGQPSFADWLARRVVADGECLRWIGTSPAGARLLAYYEGDRYLVNRLVWQQHHGEIPTDLWVVHRAHCQFEDCVNIAHLQLALPADRQADVAQLGGFAWGERHWNVRLTAESATDILRSPEPVAVLAQRYGVSLATVRAIKAGRRWRHLRDQHQ